MIYPRRAKRERMNVRELPWWRSESYKRYVRGFACIVPGCTASPREACHIRFGTDGCKDEKPSDFFCYPACREHHAEQAMHHDDLGTMSGMGARVEDAPRLAGRDRAVRLDPRL